MKNIIILCCILLLCGCGFHPTGFAPLAPVLHTMYLQTNMPYNQLTRQLKQYLKTSGVCLTTTPQQACLHLVILSEETGQQLISVSSSQQTRQYNLTLTVTFQVTDAQGRSLTPPQIVSELRTVTMQTSQMLGGSNEANILYQQMRRAIVADIISRLSSEDITAMLMNKPL